MWELVKSGGWMMLPIILSSIAAMAIVAERLWTLRASRVTPEHLLGQVWVWIKDKQLNKEKLKELRANSPLGEILRGRSGELQAWSRDHERVHRRGRRAGDS